MTHDARACRRFARSIIRTKNCWLWMMARDRKGYGTYGGYRKPHLAHRMSWEIFRGEIPQGLCVLHKCDVSNCVRPDHLWLGTIQENNRDMRSKRRHAFGERCGTSKLKETDIPKIFLMRKEGKKLREISAVFGVDKSNICSILKGKRWSHAYPAN